ncbi:MAG: hypothetical protein HY370_00375 [Proteobacteria bacterium]|nr:hypothetical protein [Pseudomonadota bacterium]
MSALNGVDVTIITNGNGRVMKLTPVEEQTSAPGIISSSPTAAAFNPANAVVKAGQVQLNKVSKYLADLPDTAKAELLVAPKDTAKIFNRALGTFNEDIASIRNIDASHGIHVDGQALTGMQIFDRPDSAKDVIYEQAWEQANALRQAVTTGLAIGTGQIVQGRKIGTCAVTVANNLRSRVGDINAALKAQGGQEIITSIDSCIAHWQFTATEDSDHRAFVYCVDFTDGDIAWVPKGHTLSSSRPVALCILAPNP